MRPAQGTLSSSSCGPERIEVDCQFVQGNSGSPIVLAASNRVLGVATYAIVRKFDSELAKDSPFKQVRRFGYRLDSVREWQEVNWTVFAREAAEIAGMQALSDQLFEIVQDFRDGDLDDDYDHQAVKTAVGALGRASTDRVERLTARKVFLDAMHRAATRDLDDFRRRATYDFHRREAEALQPFRDALAEYFAKVRDIYRDAR